MRRITGLLILFLAACGPEPDLMLPLAAPVPVDRSPAPSSQPRREALAMVSAGKGGGDPLLQFSPQKFERRPTRLLEPERERLFEAILDRRRASYGFGQGSECGYPNPWLVWMIRGGHLEAQHFADLYPDTAQRLALGVIQDEECYVGDLRFVMDFIRPKRAPIGRALEAELVRLTDHEDSGISWHAQVILGYSALEPYHRPLFRRLCLKGSGIAFDLLSLEPDPETKKFMEELSRRVYPEDSVFRGLPFLARRTLERLTILDAPDWRERVLKHLQRKKPDDYNEWEWWAESVAYKRMPEQSLAHARLQHQLERRRLQEYSRDLEPSKRSFTADSVRRGEVRGADTNFDCYLVGYAEQGGDLTVWEVRRLVHFGYLGDRETRLQEVLDPQFSWYSRNGK